MRYAKILSAPMGRVYGIELKPKYVKLAEKHFKVLGINLEHDTFPFPFPDQEIEVIICNC